MRVGVAFAQAQSERWAWAYGLCSDIGTNRELTAHAVPGQRPAVRATLCDALSKRLSAHIMPGQRAQPASFPSLRVFYNNVPFKPILMQHNLLKY